jgi:hypothetical protein
MAIHEWNQRDSTMAVQRKLEILADANLARGIPQKAMPFIALSDPFSPHLLEGGQPDLGFRTCDTCRRHPEVRALASLEGWRSP